jgi:hypothetical protein
MRDLDILDAVKNGDKLELKFLLDLVKKKKKKKIHKKIYFFFHSHPDPSIFKMKMV